MIFNFQLNNSMSLALIFILKTEPLFILANQDGILRKQFLSLIRVSICLLSLDGLINYSNTLNLFDYSE